MGRRNFRQLSSESLETRRPLAADLAALDVNEDRLISPVDALIVINQINVAYGGRATTAEAEASLDCDTNADGVVSPQDVLTILNAINTGVTTVGPGPVADELVAVPDEPVDDSPNQDDDPVDDSPVDDTPVDDTPVDDTPVDDTPVDDTPVDDTPVDDTPVDDTPVDDTPVDDTPEDEPDDGGDTGDDGDEDDTTDDDDNSDHECEHDPESDRADNHRGLRGHWQPRGNWFERLDRNDDGSLTSDEVPEALWDRLLEADANEDGGVTETELADYREAQRLAAVEAVFKQMDSDESGALTSSDLPRIAWRFVSRADANNDGQVTLEEFTNASLRFH